MRFYHAAEVKLIISHVWVPEIALLACGTPRWAGKRPEVGELGDSTKLQKDIMEFCWRYGLMAGSYERWPTTPLKSACCDCLCMHIFSFRSCVTFFCLSHPPFAGIPKQTCLHFPNLSHLVLINLPPLCFQVFTACLQVSDVKMCFLFVSFPPWFPRASSYSFLWTPPQRARFPPASLYLSLCFIFIFNNFFQLQRFFFSTLGLDVFLACPWQEKLTCVGCWEAHLLNVVIFAEVQLCAKHSSKKAWKNVLHTTIFITNYPVSSNLKSHCMYKIALRVIFQWH